MTGQQVKITMIGRHLAKEGLEFVYKGEIAGCEGCKVYKVCHNLTPKRRYRITGIRNTAIHSCDVHADGVCAVDVIEAPVPALIPAAKAIQNSKVLIDEACSCTECENYDLCVPEGLIPGEYYTVNKIIKSGVNNCERGESLRLVELIPV